jgi:hypothetical protein
MKENKLLWHRVKLITLVLVFVSPFIGGWMALYVFELKPESVNYGNLVQPVKKLEWPVLESIAGEQFEGGFGRKWIFLLFARESCSEQCQSNLFYMRQIRTLLGRDTPRLQNVLVMTGTVDDVLGAFLTDYPDLVVIQNNNETLYSQFRVSGVEPVGSTPRLYLVDPDNNYMMYYPAEIDHYRVLDDIKKLMKLSQIG